MGAQCSSDPKSVIVALRYHLSIISVPRASLTATVPHPCFLLKVVLFGEIEVNPSDVKHVMKLVGYGDGLGVVVTAHTHRWNVI